MSDLARLEAEVRQLSAEVARQRRLARVAGMVVIAGGLFAGTHWDDRITTRELDIVDRTGLTVASLSADYVNYGENATHGAVLTMNDGGGHVVDLRNSGESGSHLDFRAGNGDASYRLVNHLSLRSDAAGASMRLGDGMGTTRVAMDVTAEDQSIKVVDKSGTMHAAIGGSDREQGMFLGDPHGGPAVGVQATAEGIGFIGR